MGCQCPEDFPTCVSGWCRNASGANKKMGTGCGATFGSNCASDAKWSVSGEKIACNGDLWNNMVNLALEGGLSGKKMKGKTPAHIDAARQEYVEELVSKYNQTREGAWNMINLASSNLDKSKIHEIQRITDAAERKKNLLAMPLASAPPDLQLSVQKRADLLAAQVELAQLRPDEDFTSEWKWVAKGARGRRTTKRKKKLRKTKKRKKSKKPKSRKSKSQKRKSKKRKSRRR